MDLETTERITGARATAPDLGDDPAPSLRQQIPRFAVVGVLNTCVDLAVLNTLTLLTGVTDGSGYAAQKAISFCVAVLFSFLLNKRWTFGDVSRTRPGRKLARFFLVSVIGALVNVSVATFVATVVKSEAVGILPAVLAGDQLWVNAGALCGTAAGFVWNFVGYRRLVFRP